MFYFLLNKFNGQANRLSLNNRKKYIILSKNYKINLVQTMSYMPKEKL